MIQITKELIYQNLLRLLEQLFRLPGAQKVQIRDYTILSPQETELIKQGAAACYHDILSDIDLSFYCSSTERLSPEQLGFQRKELLGLSRREEMLETRERYTLFRVILKNGMRYDIGIYQPEAEKLPTPTELPAATTEATVKTTNSTNSDMTETDSFWFIAVQALAKLYRRDYLIADHLTNLLINETLVAQMVERDKRYGTTIHRYGYAEKLAYQEKNRCQEIPLYQKISAAPRDFAMQDETFSYIADKLFRAAAAYDRLTSAANPAYEERCAVFYELWECYHKG